MGLKQLFKSEVRRELEKFKDDKNEFFVESDIQNLPEPIQRYFRFCGYIGNEKAHNAEVLWDNVLLRTDPDKSWMKIKCIQFNSVPQPCRIVYMKNNINGIIPFEGRDKLQDGHGNMVIRLAKVIKLADDISPEMDKSALVTTLAEALILPNYALQDYIKWSSIDKYTASATMTYDEISVQGIFTFNEKGENIRFDTNDRYRSERGQNKPVKWATIYSGYKEKDGIKFPGELSALWIGENTEFEYYRGRIIGINYNIKSI